MDVRNLLMAVGGIGSYDAELCIPQMFLMPRTTDPDNASTIMLIEGLQRGVNRVGGQLEINGLLVPQTVQALRVISGDSWMSKTWLQIYGDIAEMMKRKLTISTVLPKEKSRWTPEATGDVFTAVPLVTFGAGMALLYFAATMTKG